MWRDRWCVIFVLWFLVPLSVSVPPESSERTARPAGPANPLDDAVRAAFLEAHAGLSVDEVLLQDEPNARFIAACRRRLPREADKDLNWRLMNLRKANQLPPTHGRTLTVNLAPYRPAAEIAARWLEDSEGLNLDRAMCDPAARREFDRVAGGMAPGVDPYLLRKAALGLRKSRRLRPELIARVADWGRSVQVLPVARIREKLEDVPEKPGVYVFRDASGYLYVGEAANLRDRLREHTGGSDRVALADYLEQHQDAEAMGGIEVEMHVFSSESLARFARYRRAYESELIASRKPRFNVRP